MTKTLKLFVVSLVLLFSSFYTLGSKSVEKVVATSSCQNVNNLEKSSDYSDSKVTIDFSDDRKSISVTGNNGWEVKKVELKVDDDNHNGFHTYSNGPMSGFNPNPGGNIDEARIDLESCPKVDWCHCEPNGNCQNLNISQNALENAGHVNASGNVLHAGDHSGKCTCQDLKNCPTNTPAPTNTPRPTNTPHPTSTPRPTSYCSPTPTNTPISTPTNTPVPTATNTPAPTNTPTETPTNTPTETPTNTPTETPTSTPTPGCPETYTCNQCIDYPQDDSQCNQNMRSYCGEYYGCGYGEDEYWSCRCEPEPTATPTVTPTQSPTPTQTPVPTPTPTNAPVGGGDNGGGNNNPGAPACNDPKPGTPSNLRVTRISSTQVRLDWDHAPAPHTSYVVAYGPSIGNYPWGSPDAGNGNSYIVNSLTPGAQYCFYVRANNNCMPGDKSNEVCINVGSTVRILGATSNYNPLVDGIRESYGGDILGTSTELMATAEVVYSTDKLPSGNLLDATQSIAVPAVGIDQQIYLPAKIGDEYTVGHHEVLHTTVDGNSVYYGHNGYDVFGGLYKVNLGDTVKTTENGADHSYKVAEKLFVHKSQVDSIKTSGDQIVLVTCSYTQPDYRIVIKASATK